MTRASTGDDVWSTQKESARDGLQASTTRAALVLSLLYQTTISFLQHIPKSLRKQKHI